MTVASQIVLADALETPVNHTFLPIGKDDKGTMWFTDTSIDSPVGYGRISVELKSSAPIRAGQSGADRSYRMRIGLHRPVLQETSYVLNGNVPAPSVAYIPRAFVEYIIPERSKAQDRKDLRKMMFNLQNDANIIAVVEGLNYLV